MPNHVLNSLYCEPEGFIINLKSGTSCLLSKKHLLNGNLRNFYKTCLVVLFYVYRTFLVYFESLIVAMYKIC
jgi:hypothetical protein